MKQEIPHLQGSHYFLHRPAIASKTWPSKSKKVFDNAVKTINWIRGCVLNHRHGRGKGGLDPWILKFDILLLTFQ